MIDSLLSCIIDYCLIIVDYLDSHFILIDYYVKFRCCSVHSILLTYKMAYFASDLFNKKTFTLLAVDLGNSKASALRVTERIGRDLRGPERPEWPLEKDGTCTARELYNDLHAEKG